MSLGIYMYIYIHLLNETYLSTFLAIYNLQAGSLGGNHP